MESIDENILNLYKDVNGDIIIETNELNELKKNYNKNIINNHLNSNEFKYIINIVDNINNIIKQPMDELGLSYQINIVGGAIRDLLLHNGSHISDLDITVDIDDIFKKEKLSKNFDKNKDQQQMQLIDIFLKEKEKIIKKYNIDIKNINREELLSGILKQLISINKSYQFKNEYVSTSQEEEYGNCYSVLKFTKDDFNIDIILTNNNLNYIDNFDLNICKVSYDYNQKNFVYNKDFFNDAINKKLTLNTKIFSTINQIEKCFNRHISKVYLKYPYQLESNYNNCATSLREYIEKKVIHFQLDKSVKSENKNIKSKFKI